MKENLTPREQDVLDEIKANLNERISISQVGKNLGMTRQRVDKYIVILKTKGHIKVGEYTPKKLGERFTVK